MPIPKQHSFGYKVGHAYDSMNRRILETVSSNGVVQTLTQHSYDNVGRPLCTAVRMNPAPFASPPASACTLGPEGPHGPVRGSPTPTTRSTG